MSYDPPNFPTRIVAGTTDTPTASDNGGIITYTSASAVTVTVNDLGAGKSYTVVQAGAGQVSLSAGTSVTLASDRASPSYKTALEYAQLGVLCYGNGTVSVNGNMQ